MVPSESPVKTDTRADLVEILEKTGAAQVLPIRTRRAKLPASNITIMGANLPAPIKIDSIHALSARRKPNRELNTLSSQARFSR